jgi:hypothetical protein
VWANTENPPTTDGGVGGSGRREKIKHRDKSKPVLVKRPAEGEGFLCAGNQNGPYNDDYDGGGDDDDDSSSGVSGLVSV